jgi:hypothetical protein
MHCAGNILPAVASVADLVTSHNSACSHGPCGVSCTKSQKKKKKFFVCFYSKSREMFVQLQENCCTESTDRNAGPSRVFIYHFDLRSTLAAPERGRK